MESSRSEEAADDDLKQFTRENISLAAFANDVFGTSSNNSFSSYETSSSFYSTEDYANNTMATLTNVSTTRVFHPHEIITDRPEVRWLFITLYTIVFCSCFFGNLMVILVVTLHWRMRSITNFCLANLAFADLCVGIFCVYQNIISYLMDSWIFGEFMCKMYHFISSLSTTASILILVVICIERYLAIIHPMRCKQMLTLNRLRVTIIGVWVLSALISSPRFHYFTTIPAMPMPPSHSSSDGDGSDSSSAQEQEVDMICIPNRTKYNSKLADMISMVLLFIAPLVVISILYFQIGVALWKSSNGRMPSATTSADSSTSSCCRDCESTVTNPTATNNHSLSFTSNNSHSHHHHRSASSFLRRLNCCKGKKQQESSRRQRRTCGSFYGTDKLIYKTVNPGNTTMNGGHHNGGNCSISCNETSLLQPITPNGNCTVIPNGCLCPSQQHSSTILLNNGSSSSCNGGDPISPTPSAILKTSKLSQTLRCCGCRKILQNANGGCDSVPVSPYLKRDSAPSAPPVLPNNLPSSPPPNSSLTPNNKSSHHAPSSSVSINSTDPIVLVKFEKNKCHKKCKKNKCTVLIRSAMPTSSNTMSSQGCLDEGIGGGCGGLEKVELANLSNNPYSSNGNGVVGGTSSSIGSTCTLTASSPGTLLSSSEGGGGSCCGCPSCCSAGSSSSCAAAELSSSMMITYCQLCSKKADGKKGGILHSDGHSGFGGESRAAAAAAAGGHGILSNSLEGGRCDKNLDCISHFTSKDSISTANSHQHLLHTPTTTMNNHQHHHNNSTTNTSCLTHHHHHCYHHQHLHQNLLHPGNCSSPPHHHHHNNHNNASSLLNTTTTYSTTNFKLSPNHHTTNNSPGAAVKGPKRMRVIRSSKYGTTALQRRRRIIRMLIVIVFAFAVCHLPFHARKIWQYWGVGYNGGSVFSQLFTPITFLIMYAQSGINPILYAFMSLKFRNSFADLLCCNMRRSLKVSRNFSVRSTNAIQLSQTT